MGPDWCRTAYRRNVVDMHIPDWDERFLPRFDADAPPVVEVVLFHQLERRRFLVNLPNSQQEPPNVPVDGVCVRVRTGERRVRRVLVLPEEMELRHTRSGDYVEFTAPRIETFRMVAMEYGAAGG